MRRYSQDLRGTTSGSGSGSGSGEEEEEAGGESNPFGDDKGDESSADTTPPAPPTTTSEDYSQRIFVCHALHCFDNRYTVIMTIAATTAWSVVAMSVCPF